MDVVVSGASGLIGTALTRRLRATGHRVVWLQRGGVTDGDVIGWDPARGLIDAPALEGFDAVVHLAGEGIAAKRWSEAQKQRIRDSREKGTSLLAGAIASREHKPRVFVSASGVHYYGNDRGDEVLTEESAPGDGFLADVAKAWEAATEPAAYAGIRTVMMRSGIVLSPHGGTLPRLLLPFKLGLGGRIASGNQWMSWIMLDDEVGAILHAIEMESLRGPVNFVSPTPVVNREFTETLGRVLHRPTILPTPLLPLKAVYGDELVESLLLASQRAVPARLEASGYQFRYSTLEDGLRAALAR
jgi:uncharacterized protein (TIGR01777 family)